MAQLRGRVSVVKGTIDDVHMGRTCPEDIHRKFHFLVIAFVPYEGPHCEQERGIRPLPTAEYADLKDGITLKCTRKQEVVSG